MIIAAVVTCFAIGSSFAQNANAPSSPAQPPSATQPRIEPSNAAPPAPQARPAAPAVGANAFTEGQAKSRIEASGFANVSALKKDEKGVWRATAMKDGKSVQVSLDAQGNVLTN
jgi:hypothetical protein